MYNIYNHISTWMCVYTRARVREFAVCVYSVCL